MWFPAVEAYLFEPLPAVVPDPLRAACAALTVAADRQPACVTSVAVHVRHGDTSVLECRACVLGLPSPSAALLLGREQGAGCPRTLE